MIVKTSTYVFATSTVHINYYYVTIVVKVTVHMYVHVL